MSDLQTLERLKLITEHNLEMAKHNEDKWPKLVDRYRNLLGKLTLQIAEMKAKAATNAKKPKRRGEV